MKIFHVITLAELGGAQSVVINLAKQSLDNGHEVFVLSQETGPMWEQLDGRVTKIRIKALQRSIHPLKELAVMAALKRIYKQYNPDVIHLHSSKIGMLGRLSLPASKIVYTVHGFDSIRLAYKKFLPIERLLKTRAKYIVGVSNYDVDMMKKEGIWNNVTAIYNGVIDWSSVSETIKNEDVEKVFNKLKNQDCFIILAIARFSLQKKFDLFCETARMMTHNTKVRFMWIGNNYQPEGLPSNVICLGEVKDAYQYLKYADLFMLPSNYEGLPMSIIESLSYGKPVIASNVGGIPEVLDGNNGFAVENIPEKCKEKIQGFIEGTFNYEFFSKNARSTFEEKFTVDKMYTQYLELYTTICNEGLKKG